MPSRVCHFDLKSGIFRSADIDLCRDLLSQEDLIILVRVTFDSSKWTWIEFVRLQVQTPLDWEHVDVNLIQRAKDSQESSPIQDLSPPGDGSRSMF